MTHHENLNWLTGMCVAGGLFFMGMAVYIRIEKSRLPKQAESLPPRTDFYVLRHQAWPADGSPEKRFAVWVTPVGTLKGEIDPTGNTITLYYVSDGSLNFNSLR